MTPQPICELENVGLRFRLQDSIAAGKQSEVWPLRSLNLEIFPGDVLGLVGRNGAGKSSCARLIAGIYHATEGVVRRSCQPILLSLGLGFDAHLTCRQNLRINGTHLGLSRARLAELEDEIFAFAELSAFRDQPLKVLSSGMRSRFAFSIAVHCEPEFLILDEVLATGDRFFREKAKDRIRLLMGTAKATLIVSHQERILRELCNKVALLDEGRIKELGAADVVLSRYHGVGGRRS